MAIETLQWVYQLSDFDTSGANIVPPNEQGAQAQGSPPFNIQLSPGASSFQIELNDGSNDGFDEVNGNSSDQLLTQDVAIDGVDYFAGDRIFVNYILEDASGFRLFSITIGTSNSGGNTTTAVITNGPMVPGQQYTFISEANVGRGEVPYSEIACFTQGARIATPEGPVAVEDLRPNDDVLAADGRVLKLRAVFSREVDALELRANERLQPVLIRQGALGGGLPRRDLRVSRQHRMLVSSRVAERMFGVPAVMTSAIKLTLLPGIDLCAGMGSVTYFHLVFDVHEVILAEGAPTESLLLTPRALAALPRAQREELHLLFPELDLSGERGKTDSFIPSTRQQKRLIERHAKNGVSALQTYDAENP